jgi:hypothetical protein
VEQQETDVEQAGFIEGTMKYFIRRAEYHIDVTRRPQESGKVQQMVFALCLTK